MILAPAITPPTADVSVVVEAKTPSKPIPTENVSSEKVDQPTLSEDPPKPKKLAASGELANMFAGRANPTSGQSPKIEEVASDAATTKQDSTSTTVSTTTSETTSVNVSEDSLKPKKLVTSEGLALGNLFAGRGAGPLGSPSGYIFY